MGQLLTAERAVVECRMPIRFEDPFCRACGAQGVSRTTVARHLAHVPVGLRPTHLLVRVRRFACTHCRRVWRQDTSSPGPVMGATDPLGGGLGDAGPCPGVHARLPGSSRPPWGNSWHTANNAILTSAQATLLDDPHRFDGVEVLGVDHSPARLAPVREVPPMCGATPSRATAMSPWSLTCPPYATAVVRPACWI